MTRVRRTQSGFPSGCLLKIDLRNEVLKQTTRNKRSSCEVCMDLGVKTLSYIEKCPWVSSMKGVFGKTSG